MEKAKSWIYNFCQLYYCSRNCPGVAAFQFPPSPQAPSCLLCLPLFSDKLSAELLNKANTYLTPSRPSNIYPVPALDNTTFENKIVQHILVSCPTTLSSSWGWGPYIQSGPNRYPIPAYCLTFCLIPNPTKSSFENHRVSGNMEFRHFESTRNIGSTLNT